MTIALGLILLITAVVVAVFGTLMHAGGSQAFPFGVEVGVVGMVGLMLVRGDVHRQVASRRLRLALDRSARQIGDALRDRDRLDRELREERARHPGGITPTLTAGTLTPTRTGPTHGPEHR